MEVAFAVGLFLLLTARSFLNGLASSNKEARNHSYVRPRVYKRWKERR